MGQIHYIGLSKTHENTYLQHLVRELGLWSQKTYLLATLRICAVYAIVTWGTRFSAIMMTIAAEFDIHTIIIIILPASSTIGPATQA